MKFLRPKLRGFATVKRVFIFVAFLYMGFLLFLYFLQRQLLYIPSAQDFASCDGFADAEKITHQGTRFYYKHFSDTVAVVYHGNAGSACERAFLKELFEANGVSYLFVEYAGYAGDRDGPNKDRLIHDVDNIRDFLTTIPISRLVVMGESLGTGIAAHHASFGEADGVILISPYTDIVEVAELRMPYIPVSMLLRDNYSTRELVKFGGEVLIVYGGRDLVIPASLTEKLIARLPSSLVRSVYIPEGNHTNLYFFPRVTEEIQRFTVGE